MPAENSLAKKTEVGHTPGPWSVSRTTGIGIESVSQCDKASNAAAVASCWPFMWMSGEDSVATMLANARLIAAAPDLLSALRGFLEMYVAMVNSGDCGNWDAETEPQVIAARAAIAKAVQS